MGSGLKGEFAVEYTENGGRAEANPLDAEQVGVQRATLRGARDRDIQGSVS
jgi:hypothetical protein